MYPARKPYHTIVCIRHTPDRRQFPPGRNMLSKSPRQGALDASSGIDLHTRAKFSMRVSRRQVRGCDRHDVPGRFAPARGAVHASSVRGAASLVMEITPESRPGTASRGVGGNRRPTVGPLRASRPCRPRRRHAPARAVARMARASPAAAGAGAVTPCRARRLPSRGGAAMTMTPDRLADPLRSGCRRTRGASPDRAGDRAAPRTRTCPPLAHVHQASTCTWAARLESA